MAEVTTLQNRAVKNHRARGGIGERGPHSRLHCSCLVVSDSFVTPRTVAHQAGSSQARTLEWVAIFFSRGSSRPRDRTFVSCLAHGFFTPEIPGKPTQNFIRDTWEEKRNVMRVITHIPEHSLSKKCTKATVNVVLGLRKGLKPARGTGRRWVAAVTMKGARTVVCNGKRILRPDVGG